MRLPRFRRRPSVKRAAPIGCFATIRIIPACTSSRSTDRDPFSPLALASAIEPSPYAKAMMLFWIGSHADYDRLLGTLR
jgi:hypothetical protein